MPRGPRKTQSGAPGQPSDPVPAQTYGAGVAQQHLARVMPSPNLQGGAQPSGGGVSGGAPPPPDPQAEFTNALQAAQGMAGMAGGLNAETARPNEPVTHGLSTGPGAGPEILGGPQSPAGDLMRRMSLETGNPMWAELAARTRS